MSKKQLDFAIQQFTGWRECKNGTGQISELVNAMGLTKKEYLAIRDDIQWLPKDDLADLETYFAQEKSYEPRRANY